MQQQELDILIVMVTGTLTFLVLSTFFVVLVYRYQKRLQQTQLELFKAVMEAQEQEQERIARDLHDQLGPSLSIIKTQIDSIDEASLNTIDRQIKIDTTSQLTNAIKELRSIAHNLIPKTYTEYGFIRSVEYYILRLREYAHLNVDFSCNTWPAGIEKAYEVSLYRIIQELFQNTLKHSGASHARLHIEVKGMDLRVEYSDNGKGLPLTEGGLTGIGLKNIASRVRLLGGQIHFPAPQQPLLFIFTFNLERLHATK